MKPVIMMKNMRSPNERNDEPRIDPKGGLDSAFKLRRSMDIPR